MVNTVTASSESEHEDEFYCDDCRAWFPKGEFRQHFHFLEK
jgi:hypothetical protein